MSEIVVLSKNELSEIIEQAVLIAVRNIDERFTKPFPEIVTLREVAAYLKVSESTVRNRIEDSNLPVNYRMGDPRFYKSEIDAWMKEKEVE